MAKKRRVLGGALLTAAATALTVKGALTSPIGAAVPSDQIQHDLAARKDAVLSQSKTVLTQAQQRLVGAVVQVASGAPPLTPAPIRPSPLANRRLRGIRKKPSTHQVHEPVAALMAI